MARPALLALVAAALLGLLAAFGASPAAAAGQDVSFASFDSLRRALLAEGLGATKANALVMERVEAKQCKLVRLVLQSVGVCPFITPGDPRGLRMVDRWMRLCRDTKPQSQTARDEFDNWYYPHFERAAATMTLEQAEDEAAELAAELATLLKAVGDLRVGAMGKRDYIKEVIKAKDGSVDTNKLLNATDYLVAHPPPKTGPPPLAALNLLTYLAREEDAALLSREETWRLLNTDAEARCPFQRAQLRREEAALELMAALSAPAYVSSLAATCDPSVQEAAQAAGAVEAIINDALAAVGAPTPVPLVPLVTASAKAAVDRCEESAAVLELGLIATSGTRVGVTVMKETIAPIVLWMRTRNDADLMVAVPLSMPQFGIVKLLRSNTRAAMALVTASAANPAGLVQAISAKVPDKKVTAETVSFAMLWSVVQTTTDDLKPAFAGVKILTSSVTKLLAAETFVTDRVGAALLADRKFMHFLYGDAPKFTPAAASRSIRGAWYRLIMKEGLMNFDKRMVAKFKTGVGLTRDVVKAGMLKFPGGAKLARVVSRIGPGLLPRVAALANVIEIWKNPLNFVGVLKNSIGLAELAEGLGNAIRARPRLHQVVQSFQARVSHRGLSTFQAGRLRNLGSVVARTSLHGLRGVGIVAKVAVKGVLKVAGPVSLALDAYDAGVMFSQGHVAAGAVKTGAVVVGAIGMAVVAALPGIGFAAIGVSILLSAIADRMVTVRERNARRGFAKALGFKAGPDALGSLEFVQRAYKDGCSVIANERPEALEAVLGGLIDGWTTDKYEWGIYRLFDCLYEQKRCDVAREIVTHGSGKLTGNALLSHIQGKQDPAVAKAMSRCGVDPGIDHWASYARIYIKQRKCSDLARDGKDLHVRLVKRLTAWYSSNSHEDSILDLFRCLKSQGKCSTVRAVVEKFGFSSLLWSLDGKQDTQMRTLLRECNFLATDDDNWARAEVDRLYESNKLMLATAPLSVQKKLLRAMFDGPTLNEDEASIHRLVKAIAWKHGKHSARQRAIQNDPRTSYQVFYDNFHGEEWGWVKPYLIKPDTQCYWHGKKWVRKYGSGGGCERTTYFTTCSKDGECRRISSGRCNGGRCACGYSGANECWCIKNFDFHSGNRVCSFSGSL